MAWLERGDGTGLTISNSKWLLTTCHRVMISNGIVEIGGLDVAC